MKKFKESAIDYFKRHPLSQECYITSDGRVFHTKGSAQSMSGTLDDGEIEFYLRKVTTKEVKTDNDAQNNEPSDAEILEKKEFLKIYEVEKLEYTELKSLVKFFNIETADQKRETLIASLNKFKLTLND
jgi:hypothetical protein